MEDVKNRIAWESDNPFWQGFSGNPKCHLCDFNPGVVYRKSHKRQNGIILESSVMYCKSCCDNRKEEVTQDFEKWWADEWEKCEAIAEKNWQEHGVYTNVSGGANEPGQLSTYFGYVKLEDGTYQPYRFAHPKNNQDLFERDQDECMKSLVDLNITEKEKFEKLRSFLESYKTEDEQIQNLVNRRIQELDEYVQRHNQE